MTAPQATPAAQATPPPALAELGAKSREACGCSKCTGGFDIGARTIGMRAGQAKPGSCLAPTYLAALLAGTVKP